MITLIFEAHSTTFDNEAELSSGHNDVDLSPLGLRQCVELRERYAGKKVDAVYTSDLQRAYKTGAIAFEGRHTPLFTDKRLRECDYGELTQQDAHMVKAQRLQRVDVPFPNGESYRQTSARMKAFLDELPARHKDGDVVMVIGHRATQYGLEHWILGKPLEEVVVAPWAWQPGWTYELKK
ncbi:MAG: histidine phosphatase family protein [Proteobacteria bacterium]|nr:histidine phosphatase family protein [Pseudomonadota bacterium]